MPPKAPAKRKRASRKAKPKTKGLEALDCRLEVTAEPIREAAAHISVAIEEAPDVTAALERARMPAGTTGVVVVTGSIYIVGEAMQALGIRI